MVKRTRIIAFLFLASAGCAAPPDDVRAPDAFEPSQTSRTASDDQAVHERDLRTGRSEAMVRSAQTGLASWYGEPFHGRLTASGEVFDQGALTAAHRTLPLRSLARVTRLDTGDSILVRINDRGPFIDGRIIDLSRAAAAELGFLDDGLTHVRVEALGPADPQDRAARSRILPRN